VASESGIPEFPKTAFEAPGVVSAVLNRVVVLAKQTHAEIEKIEADGDFGGLFFLSTRGANG